MIKKVLSISCIKKYIIIIILGFITGCILCNTFSNEVVSQNTDFFAKSMKTLKNSTVLGSDILYILIEKRLFVFIILAIIGLSGAGKSIMALFLFWFSEGFGMFMAALIKICGIKALFVGLCFCLPQYIIYVPVFEILYRQIHKFHSNFSWQTKEYRGRKKGPLATPLMEYILSFVVLSICVFIGIVLEAYINPFLIKKIVMIL